MQDKFIEGFVTDCIKLGKKSPEEICKCAEATVLEINKRLIDLNKLRTKRSKLKLLIKGLSPKKRRSRKEIQMIDPSLPDEYLVGPLREICIKICNYIEEHKKATPTDVMNHIANIEQQKPIYRAIKYLTDRKIIKRDGPNQIIVAGNSWESRPKEKSSDEENV